VNHLYITKSKAALELIPEGPCVLFPYARIYVSVGVLSFSVVSYRAFCLYVSTNFVIILCRKM